VLDTLQVVESIEAVRDFWDAGSCGEVYLQGLTERDRFQTQASIRYELEPYIRPFARFDGRNQAVLEIGIGLGADHEQWAKSSPTRLVGIDLTPRALQWTKRRFALRGSPANLALSSAESLPFRDACFDIVYSWGVLHVTPDTRTAFAEAYRVLRPGGELRAMIYHRPSFVGLMLRARYGWLRLKPWMSHSDLYGNFLESPGTKAFTPAEARSFLPECDSVEIRTVISFGDLLQGAVGQRHQGQVLAAAKRLWPRTLVRRLPRFGLYMLINAKKSPHRTPAQSAETNQVSSL
jgi:SAM-dependent methyltransferase